MLHVRLFALASSLAALAAPSVAHAAKYGRAGCGLGSIIIKPSGNQSSAAITNSFAYSQLFGITSGTSNCQPGGKDLAEEEQQRFIASNLNTLSKEMAQGNGETLDAFAGVLGCEKDSYGQVAESLRASYTTIFAAPGAIAVLDAAKAELRDDEDVAPKCQFL